MCTLPWARSARKPSGESSNFIEGAMGHFHLTGRSRGGGSFRLDYCRVPAWCCRLDYCHQARVKNKLFLFCVWASPFPSMLQSFVQSASQAESPIRDLPYQIGSRQNYSCQSVWGTGSSKKSRQAEIVSDESQFRHLSSTPSWEDSIYSFQCVTLRWSVISQYLWGASFSLISHLWNCSKQTCQPSFQQMAHTSSSGSLHPLSPAQQD